MPQGPEAQAPQEAETPIKDILVQVGEGLAQIAEKIQSTPGMAESDISAINEIVGKYVDFVENKLGKEEPGETKEEPTSQEMQGQMPMNQGMGGAPQTQNMRQ